jgi:rhomboid protease GluP
MCPHCRAFVSSSDRVCTECRQPLGKPYAQRMANSVALAGLVPPTHFTTLIILLINAGLFAATLLMSMRKMGGDALWSIDGYVLYYFGAKESESILAGHQWWRLLTAGFLHGGLVHILMNSWALYDLGAQVEEAYGTARFLVFYLLSSAAGFVASTFWSQAISIGASAAIFGLIGAMIAYWSRHRTLLGGEMKSVYVRWAIYGILFGLLPMFRMDNAAHIGGLAAGFLLAYVSGSPTQHKAIEWLWRLAAAFSVALATVSFLFVWLAFPAS